MRNRTKSGWLVAVALLSACGAKQTSSQAPPEPAVGDTVETPEPPTPTVEEVLNEYRSSAEWKQSEAAFKEIMRHYVHGESIQLTDAELSDDFEAFSTLSEQDVNDFVSTQSCLDGMTDAVGTYYSVNTMHQRHDGFVAQPSPHPLTGSGADHAHAVFSANMLMQRTEISHDKPLPARAAMPGAHFANWQAIADTMTDRAKFDALFLFLDRAQSSAVFAVTSKLDWDSKVSGQVFVAPELHNGQVFSPALFSTYIFKKDDAAKYSVFVIISASAQGVPTTPYAGLIENKEAMYKSKTGFSFTYLSTNENLLDYRFIMESEAPLSFDLRITTAYPAHPQSPYLTINSKFTPIATDQKVERYLKSKVTRLLLMVRKGALMRDLIKVYYPKSSAAQLWVDVGALSKSTGFAAKLKAAGLDLAVDVFARDVWLEKPRISAAGVDAAGDLQFRAIDQPACK